MVLILVTLLFIEIADLIQQTELYKKNPSRFSLKLHELVPENCRCPKVIEDIPEKRSEKRIIEMDEKLPKLIYKRAGNTRTVVMTIYCVKDRDGEVGCALLKWEEISFRFN